MYQTLCLEAIFKLVLEADEAAAASVTPQRRLFVQDKRTGQQFLVDTGAAISVLPRNPRIHKNPSGFNLVAANNTIIPTFGEKTLHLDLGLRRPLKWTFVFAEIGKPILGADFLYNHGLTVDLRRKKLTDQRTGLATIGRVSMVSVPSISTIPGDCKYSHLLKEFPNLTRPSPIRGPPRTVVQHHIFTSGNPVTSKARRLPPEKYTAVKQHFQELINEGICRPSNSPWSSPLHVVIKKDGSLRPCGDYRRLNSQTIPDRYPVPNLMNFTTQLHGKKVFSTLDVVRAFYHIPVAEEDIKKTAVITPFGLIEYVRMCFGLRNAAQTFQRFSDEIMRDLDYVFPYLDDFFIASKDEKEHETHLREVFSRLDANGLSLNVSKCIFGKQEVDFLGFRVNAEGISPLPSKVKTIMDFPRPTTICHLRRFLGMSNFYRRCLPRAAEIQEPLNKLLHDVRKKDKRPVEWTEASIQAFNKCKESLAAAAQLAHQSTSEELSLACDASDTGIGAVLQQLKDGVWRPLGFFSKSLTPTQKNYSTYDRELLAIYEGIKHFRSLLEGLNFTIVTDHKPLTHVFLQKADNASPRRIRQLNYISQFTTSIFYKPGKENVVADTLSRVDEVQMPDDFEALASAQKSDPAIKDLKENPKLTFKLITMPGRDTPIFCETSTTKARPYVPENFRKPLFDRLHGLSHPGVRASRKLISSRYFWPNMNADIGKWAKTCIPCQRAKIQRHTITPLGTFQSAARFQHVHLDLIGPLPPSYGKRYCLTMVDRATRWPEAIPLEDITAATISEAFYVHWIARFGTPARISTDQGRQFEAEIFQRLTQLLGIDKKRTTAYHPQANGCVERWHRSLKAAIMAHLDNDRWTQILPSVLLGLRSALREDMGASVAEGLYGQPLRLPGEFFEDTPVHQEPTVALQLLKQDLAQFKPAETRTTNRNVFLHKDLQNCSHVFLREDAVRRPLVPPYSGPHKVLSRTQKHYKILIGERESVVSLDRLKPAYLINDHHTTVDSHTPPPSRPSSSKHRNEDSSKKPSDPGSATPSKLQPASQSGYRTRSGRLVKSKVHFCDSITWGGAV